MYHKELSYRDVERVTGMSSGAPPGGSVVYNMPNITYTPLRQIYLLEAQFTCEVYDTAAVTVLAGSSVDAYFIFPENASPGFDMAATPNFNPHVYFETGNVASMYLMKDVPGVTPFYVDAVVRFAAALPAIGSVTMYCNIYYAVL